MELRVNDYVRTKSGIHKIFRINENATVWKYECDKKEIGEYDSSYTYIKIKEENIIKSSPNIIDLIEVGDYVNGSKVLDIAQAPKKAIYTEQENGGALLPIVNNRIESILTKEQFESMKYKIGE